MKENELRIGNWFIDHEAEPETTIFWQVESIERASNRKGKLGVRYRKGSCWIIAEHMVPIPLTPEWLERLGLRCPHGDIWYFDKINQFWFQDLTGLDTGLNYCMGFNDQWAGVNIEYVHQLQNLYFALTGEELEMKE